MESGRRFASAIRSLTNARDLQLECAGALHETLLVPVLMNGSEIILWKEKERSRNRAVHMDNFRGLLDIRRMDIVQNAQIRKLCGVTKCVDGKIDEGVLRWFDNVERIENEMNAKRVYVGVCW